MVHGFMERYRELMGGPAKKGEKEVMGLAIEYGWNIKEGMECGGMNGGKVE